MGGSGGKRARRRDGGDPDTPDTGDPLAEYGRGTYDEETGLWERYDVPEKVLRARAQPDGPTWTQVWEHPTAILADLAHTYGVHIDPARLATSVLASRSTLWLDVMISGLLADPSSRLARALRPPPDQGGGRA